MDAILRTIISFTILPLSFQQYSSYGGHPPPAYAPAGYSSYRPNAYPPAYQSAVPPSNLPPPCYGNVPYGAASPPLYSGAPYYPPVGYPVSNVTCIYNFTLPQAVVAKLISTEILTMANTPLPPVNFSTYSLPQYQFPPPPPYKRPYSGPPAYANPYAMAQPPPYTVAQSPPYAPGYPSPYTGAAQQPPYASALPPPYGTPGVDPYYPPHAYVPAGYTDLTYRAGALPNSDVSRQYSEQPDSVQMTQVVTEI